MFFIIEIFRKSIFNPKFYYHFVIHDEMKDLKAPP